MFKQLTFTVFVIVGTAMQMPAALMTHADCSAELDGVSQSQGGSGGAQCSVSNGSGSMNGEAGASARYGSLNVSASAFGQNLSSTISASSSASATAAFEDTLIILGSGSGFVRATLIFSVSVQDGSKETDFRMAGYVAPSVPGGQDGGAVIDVDIPVDFGVPIPVSAFLSVGGSASSDFGPGGAIASFDMVELFILGADSVPLSNSRYTAASNADYSFLNAALVPVPEPGTAGFLIIGCSAACLGRLLHRRSSGLRRSVN
jgi:hypothetical protein